MVTGHVFIATSLDGFVARGDHRLDWLMKQNTEGEDHGYDAFMESVDGIVMGRGSFETVLGFDEWPYTKPVIVMSRSLDNGDIPKVLWPTVRLSNAEPADLMASLEGEGWSRAYIDGGRLVQSFLREGLVSDLIITVVPVLIGEGIRLFGELNRDVDLELMEHTAFKSGLVQSRYRIGFDSSEIVR